METKCFTSLQDYVRYWEGAALDAVQPYQVPPPGTVIYLGPNRRQGVTTRRIGRDRREPCAQGRRYRLSLDRRKT